MVIAEEKNEAARTARPLNFNGIISPPDVVRAQ
jgi:hypothetical protein